jgi:phage terminase large subunit
VLQSPVDTRSAPLFAGVDVGGGEAETVVYVCESTHEWRGIVAMGTWRGEDTRGQVVKFLNQFRSRLALVLVDGIGVGHNFGLHLRDCRFPVELVNVAMPCESKPRWGENDPARRFVNLRACYFQALADAFERDQVEGLTDETTIGQLAGLLYEFDSQGRIKIESKEKARERGVPSPDRADALMLALCKPYESLAASLAPVYGPGVISSGPRDPRAEELEYERRIDSGERYTNPSRFSRIKGAW